MDQLFGNVKNVKPIRDIVYEQLRKAILDNKLKSGERIVEKEYADKMNISRTPVREALRKLEIEGFVEYIPRKGVMVKGFTFNDIIEIYEIRKSLESLAVKHTIHNISDDDIDKLKGLVKNTEELDKKGKIDEVFEVSNEFHKIILDSSSMPRLQGMINNLQEYLERFRRVTMSKDARRHNAIREHREILESIMEKDVEKAQEKVSKHIEASRKVFLAECEVNLD